ncbi:MAG: tRNA pseudouridine(55) synthase TruB [Gammaproteobacteria bacterium]|nr:tRNA pseudouridine(55) synthase TruB [Gammaproteobacteria bacterium]
MGRRRVRKGRPVNGILLLDKPIGMSSNQALQKVKRLFNAQKAGHTGNLDPLATGVLPICLGEGTKVSAFLLDADKRYTGKITLGQRTSTADSEGEVIDTAPIPELNKLQLESVLQQFLGEIEQIPPMYSALKVDGQPLYKLAHKGVEIERKARRIQIYELNLLSFEGDSLEIDVHCSKGTYIRTLAEDIGKALGTVAYLSALRRTVAGPFRLEECVDMATLEHVAEDKGPEQLDEFLAPMESALEDWPDVVLSENAAFFLGQGQPVVVPNAPTEGMVRLFDKSERFLGVGIISDDGKVAPKRLFNTA